jgi:transcription elongation factor SPT5
MHAGGATPAIHGFGGATPSHSSAASDEVWRPGGAIDQETIKDDGWGMTDPFSDTTPADVDGSGWQSTGVRSNDAWAANQKSEDNKSIPQQETYSVVSSIKREHMKSELDSEVGVDTEETPVWFMERVCVMVKENFKSGVIREINPDKTAVVEMDDDRTARTVRVVDVSMIPPAEHDTVLVTGGNEIGLEGSLVCVDGKSFVLVKSLLRMCTLLLTRFAGSDAILKDANDEFKIIDYVHLVKITPECSS